MAHELVDLSRLTDIFEGDAKFLIEVYTTYLDEGAERVVELGSAIEAKDATKCYELAHAIKGASANVGANRVQDISSSIEIQGRASELSGIDDAYKALLSDI